MKFTIPAGVFASTMAAISRVAPARGNYPIIECALITAAAGTVTIRGYSGDTEIELQVAAEVETDGVIAAPARLLADIVKRFQKDAPVIVEAKSATAGRVRSGRSNIGLALLDPGPFPSIAASKSLSQFTISGQQLAKALSIAARFYSTDAATKPYLTGMSLSAAKDGAVLRFVTTDSYRLSMFDIEAPAGAEFMPSIIIPARSVEEIHRLAESATQVSIDVSDKRVVVGVPGTRFTTKLIEDKYPPVEKVVARVAPTCEATVDAKATAAAVGRIGAVVTAAGSKGLKLTFGPDTLMIGATAHDHGSSQDEVSATLSGADSFVIGYSEKQLSEMLGIHGGGITFCLEAEDKPSLLRSTEEPGWTGLLVPMRVA